jgi:hypothetical protein
VVREMSMRATGNQASLNWLQRDPGLTWLDRSRSLKAGLFDPRPYAMPRDRVRAVEGAFLKTLKDPEFVTEAEKTRMTLNPIPGTTLHSVIVEGLSMPAALKEKLKPILAPKG